MNTFRQKHIRYRKLSKLS